MGATHADERRGGPNIGKRSLQDDGEEGEVGLIFFFYKIGIYEHVESKNDKFTMEIIR